MTTPSLLSVQSVRQHLLAMIRHTSLLLFGCLMAQLPIALAFAPQFAASVAWNICVHACLVLLTPLLCAHGALNLARLNLNLVFASYLLHAVLLWGPVLYIQHFLLLGVVTSGLFYATRESFWQMVNAVAFAALFVTVEGLYCWPMDNWQQLLRFCNALTLAFSSLGLLWLFRQATVIRWRQLKNLHQQTRDTLARFLPRSPGQPEQLWPVGETRRLASVSVLFADFAGYTSLSDHFDDEQIVAMLDALYREFDTIAARHKVEKLKTNGDEYMAVSGVSMSSARQTAGPCPAAQMCQFACQLQHCFRHFCDELQLPCQLRIGIATGSVTAGIIGHQKPAFDVWGKTVNLAARLEQSAQPGSIVTGADTRQLALSMPAQPQLVFSPASLQAGKPAYVCGAP